MVVGDTSSLYARGAMRVRRFRDRAICEGSYAARWTMDWRHISHGREPAVRAKIRVQAGARRPVLRVAELVRDVRGWGRGCGLAVQRRPRQRAHTHGHCSLEYL